MQPIRGDCIRIALFEGAGQEVMVAIDQWFEGQGMVAEVVDIEYNYQGPEYDGSKKLSERGTHGVLIVFKPLRINAQRDPQLCQDGGWNTDELDAACALDCDHEWVDAINEVVLSGKVCLKCGAVRSPEEE